MSYYLEVQPDGSEKKVPKKKGPTRKGWIPNPNNPEEYISDKNAIAAPEKAFHVYIRFDGETGEYANHKDVGRGRKSLTYVKFQKIDNELKLAAGETLNPPHAKLDTIPTEVGVVATSTTTVTPIPEDHSKIQFDSLHKCLKAGKLEKSGPIHVYKLVDIVGDPKIDYLRNNRAVSRVEVNTESGDVSVWNVAYDPEKPDALISGVVK